MDIITKSLLIINADDYGRSIDINSAIIDSIKRGLVTDTSMIATIEDSFQDACKKEYKDYLDSKLGVHFCLTLGTPLTDAIKKDRDFCDENGDFLQVFKDNINWTKEQKSNLYLELCAQVEKIRKSGFTITHADSHQHVHLVHNILPVFIKCCKDMGIPVLRLMISENETGKRKMWHVLEKLYYRLNGLRCINDFSTPLSFSFKYNHRVMSISELMVHPVYNSKGEIANKVAKIEKDDCGILEHQLKDILPNFFCTSFQKAFRL